LIDNRGAWAVKRKVFAVADEDLQRFKTRWSDSLRRYFLAGLLVFLPLAITLWFIGWVIDLLDSVLAVLPDALHPNSYLPLRFLKLGAVVTLFADSLSWRSYPRRGDAAIPRGMGKCLHPNSGVSRHFIPPLPKNCADFLRPIECAAQVVMIDIRASAVHSGLCHGRAWSHWEEKKNAQLSMSSFRQRPNPTSGFFLLVPING